MVLVSPLTTHTQNSQETKIRFKSWLKNSWMDLEKELAGTWSWIYVAEENIIGTDWLTVDDEMERPGRSERGLWLASMV